MCKKYYEIILENFNFLFYSSIFPIFSCVQQSWNATQEMQFRSSVHPDPFAQIKWISLTLSLISTKTILSVQFNQFSQLSHSISSVSSGNWLAQLKLIFSQNHLIKLKVNHVSFTLVMLYVPIWKQYSNSEPILACANFLNRKIGLAWCRPAIWTTSHV